MDLCHEVALGLTELFKIHYAILCISGRVITSVIHVCDRNIDVSSSSLTYVKAG